MPRWIGRRRHQVEQAVLRTREGYDTALSEGGVVLFQQVAPGVDGHYVSTSMTATLGWDAGAFRSPGTLRRLVHPDDLATFRRMVPVGPVMPSAPAFPAGPIPTPPNDATPVDGPGSPDDPGIGLVTAGPGADTDPWLRLPDPAVPAAAGPVIDLTDKAGPVSVQPGTPVPGPPVAAPVAAPPPPRRWPCPRRPRSACRRRSRRPGWPRSR